MARFAVWTCVKSRVLIAIAIGLLTLVTPLSLWAQDISELKKGVVKITAQAEGKERVGTGFILRLEEKSVYIVTAAHVVSGDPNPRVEYFGQGNKVVRVNVLHLEGGNAEQGLAILLVKDKDDVPSGLTQLELASFVTLSGGEDVTIIGFPHRRNWAVVKGNISVQQGRIIEVNATISEGNSGGPVIKDSKVVGLVTDVREGFGHAVTARSVQDYVEGLGISLAPPTAKVSRRPFFFIASHLNLDSGLPQGTKVAMLDSRRV